MNKVNNIFQVLVLITVIVIFFTFIFKPKEVAGYFDPVSYYSNVTFIQTGNKQCKIVTAGNKQGKLVKVKCKVFSNTQLAQMKWRPAY